MKAKFTIKKKLFWATYLLILMLTLLIDCLVFYTYKNDIEDKIEQFGEQTIDEMASNMSKKVLSEEESITYKINYSNLLSAESDYEKYTENSKEIKVFVALVANSGMKVQSCYITRSNGKEEFWTDGSTNTDIFHNSMAGKFLEENDMNENRGTVIWRYFSDTPDSVYIFKNIVDYDTLQKQATLCIQIDNSYFHSLENNTDFYILINDEEGNLLYSSKEITPFVQNFQSNENHKYIIMSEQLAKKNWTLTGLISKHQALYNLNHLVLILLVLEVIFFLITFYIVNYVSENMTANIKALIANMKLIEQGKQAELIQAKSVDETAYLVEAFNNMNQKLQDTIEQLIINQTQKEKAEYNALIAQLNPHFLYNSLESINAMAKLNEQREIVEAIGNLSKLLRVCLSENNSEISVRQELDYITQYLSLERLITGGQIDWDITCADNVLEYQVPKLILQPLVENCIIHGFKKYCEEAIIVIVVRVENETLVMEVSDNGNGMTQEQADKILAGKGEKKAKSDRRHIGIVSIQQRIKYLYGEEYGISIRTTEHSGTTVKLVFPISRRW